MPIFEPVSTPTPPRRSRRRHHLWHLVVFSLPLAILGATACDLASVRQFIGRANSGSISALPKVSDEDAARLMLTPTDADLTATAVAMKSPTAAPTPNPRPARTPAQPGPPLMPTPVIVLPLPAQPQAIAPMAQPQPSSSDASGQQASHH